jgi:hypothetical protein
VNPVSETREVTRAELARDFDAIIGWVEDQRAARVVRITDAPGPRPVYITNRHPVTGAMPHE